MVLPSGSGPLDHVRKGKFFDFRSQDMSYSERLRNIAGRPWFSYLTLLTLQAKVLWGIWAYKDITFGDTSVYFRDAYRWFHSYKVNIAWSPLYTAFYGSLLHVSTDPYTVIIFHRIIIVFAITIMVLALMRRLLPHPIAWIVSAWWAILPIHFDSLYEVHLFAVIAPLAACLLAASKRTAWARGCALAIIAASSILIRNELVIATAVLGLAYVLWEIRLIRIAKSETREIPPSKNYLYSYVLPLFLAALVVLFFYWRSDIKYPQLRNVFASKHTQNMCQVYAFGYQQRHPEWTKSPWLDCEELIQRHFGSADLSLFDMLRRNPKAVLENMLWNIRLTPDGLQLLLFNAISGSVTPDYIMPFKSKIVVFFSLITITILICGTILLYRNKSFWWTYWIEPHLMGWITLGSLAAVAPFIILTQRPRPSYLLTTGIFLAACVGLCSFAILHRLFLTKGPSSFVHTMSERLSTFIPLVLIPLVLAVPSYYPLVNKTRSRPLLELYRNLAPFRNLIDRPDVGFMVNKFPSELRSYLVATKARPFMVYRLVEETPLSMSGLVRESPSKDFTFSVYQFPKRADDWTMSIEEYLDRTGADLIYVDHNLRTVLDSQSMNRTFVRSPESVGWKIISQQKTGTNGWMLLEKVKRNNPSSVP